MELSPLNCPHCSGSLTNWLLKRIGRQQHDKHGDSAAIPHAYLLVLPSIDTNQLLSDGPAASPPSLVAATRRCDSNMKTPKLAAIKTERVPDPNSSTDPISSTSEVVPCYPPCENSATRHHNSKVAPSTINHKSRAKTLKSSQLSRHQLGLFDKPPTTPSCSRGGGGGSSFTNEHCGAEEDQESLEEQEHNNTISAISNSAHSLLSHATSSLLSATNTCCSADKTLQLESSEEQEHISSNIHNSSVNSNPCSTPSSTVNTTRSSAVSEKHVDSRPRWGAKNTYRYLKRTPKIRRRAKRPFVCRGCSTRFLTKKGLALHSCSHDSKKMAHDPFTPVQVRMKGGIRHKCSLCGKVLGGEKNFRKHLGLHARNRCDSCGKMFVSDSALTLHVTKEHSSNFPENPLPQEGTMGATVKPRRQIALKRVTVSSFMELTREEREEKEDNEVEHNEFSVGSETILNENEEQGQQVEANHENNGMEQEVEQNEEEEEEKWDKEEEEEIENITQVSEERTEQQKMSENKEVIMIDLTEEEEREDETEQKEYDRPGIAQREKYMCDVCGLTLMQYTSFMAHMNCHHGILTPRASSSSSPKTPSFSSPAIFQEKSNLPRLSGINLVLKNKSLDSVLQGYENTPTMTRESSIVGSPSGVHHSVLPTPPSGNDEEEKTKKISSVRYYCHKCNRSYNNLNALHYHEMFHPPDAQREYSPSNEEDNEKSNPSSIWNCKYCGKPYKDKRRYEDHLLFCEWQVPKFTETRFRQTEARLRKSNNKDGNGGEEHHFMVTSQSSSRGDDGEGNGKDHRLEDKDVVRYHCQKCPRHYKYKRDLLRHERKKHATATVQCPQCNRVLSSKYKLYRHMQCLHSDKFLDKRKFHQDIVHGHNQLQRPEKRQSLQEKALPPQEEEEEEEQNQDSQINNTECSKGSNHAVRQLLDGERSGEEENEEGKEEEKVEEIVVADIGRPTKTPYLKGIEKLMQYNNCPLFIEISSSSDEEVVVDGSDQQQPNIRGNRLSNVAPVVGELSDSSSKRTGGIREKHGTWDVIRFEDALVH